MGPELAVSNPVILGVCENEVAYLKAPADASLLLDDEGIVWLVSLLPLKGGWECVASCDSGLSKIFNDDEG
jgi:hypothetical protein